MAWDLALVAPAFGGWLGASLSLVVSVALWEAKIGAWLIASKLLPKLLVNWASGYQVAPDCQNVPPITSWPCGNDEN